MMQVTLLCGAVGVENILSIDCSPMMHDLTIDV